MAELVADYVLERLREWGVQRIYGYPGDGINAFLGALDRAQDKLDFVQTRLGPPPGIGPSSGGSGSGAA